MEFERHETYRQGLALEDGCPSRREQYMGRSGNRRFSRRLLGALVGVGAMMLSLTVIGASSATSTPKAASTGTITFAELPGSGPNYIFPFADLSYFSVSNSSTSRIRCTGRSTSSAREPTRRSTCPSRSESSRIYSDGNKTVTINLNHYVWSNGETVTAQDVAFWLNIYRTDPGGYAGYCRAPSPMTSPR